PCKPLGVFGDLRPRAGQPDVGSVDAERIHVMEDLDLLVDTRVAYRRRLQSIPQRLVVEHRHGAEPGGIVVPVENQRMRLDAQSGTLGTLGIMKMTSGWLSGARRGAQQEEADAKNDVGNHGPQ